MALVLGCIVLDCKSWSFSIVAHESGPCGSYQFWHFFAKLACKLAKATSSFEDWFKAKPSCRCPQEM